MYFLNDIKKQKNHDENQNLGIWLKKNKILKLYLNVLLKLI
jgi:hypothetical protein